MTRTTKRLFNVILAIVMVAALLLGCVACSKPAKNGNDTNAGNKEDDASKYEGLSDVEYAQTLTMDQLEGAVDALAAGVGAYADMVGASSGDMGAKADLTLTLGDLVIDLIEQAVFGTADSGMDMSFLTNIGLGLEIDSTAAIDQLQVTLGLSNTEIVKLLLLANDESFWVGAPDLTDSFLEANFANLGVAVNTATPAWMDGMLTAIPSEEKIAEILNRYLALAIKEMDRVERTTSTLQHAEINQDCTALTIKIYEEDTLAAAKAVLNAAKTDADIKKIVEDFGKFYNDMMTESYTEFDMEWTDVDLYAAFTEEIDSTLTNLPAEAKDTEKYINLTLYVDDKHNIIGGNLISADDENICSYHTVTDGNVFSTLIAAGENDLTVNGTGTTNNGIVDGQFKVYVESTPVFELELKSFDTTNKDAIRGTVVLKPTDKAIEAIFNGPIPILNTKDVALEIKMDSTKDKSDVAIKLLGDNAMIIDLALRAAAKTPAALQKPTNTTPLTGQESVAGLLADMDFTSVFANLRTAGVPEILVSALESLIPVM